MLKKLFFFIFFIIISPFFFAAYFIIVFLKVLKPKRETPNLIWGPEPLISNKYWSDALNKKGFKSETLMEGYYASIHKESDYDKYTYNFLPFLKNTVLRKVNNYMIAPYISFIYAINNFDIFHYHFTSGFLKDTPLMFFESGLLKLAGCKVIVTAYGGDFYRLSKVNSISWRHGLLVNYPILAKVETKIEKKVKYWIKNADFIINGFQIDGLGRWDIFPYNMVVINTEQWPQVKRDYANDGANGTVKVVHTPNHRGVKGTEYIVNAIKELKAEGLKVELVLLEKVQNEEVRRILQEEADILVEQLILGFGMSAIEGMSSGLPVMSNLSEEDYTRAFRRFSYLNECPILSSTPENVKENLRALITYPTLRKALGEAGNKYVEKYHSNKTAQAMFSAIYEKIWNKKDIELMNFFHPLFPNSYNNSLPIVEHPLFENKLPDTFKSN